MDTTRPITDYEVECIDDNTLGALTNWNKYPILLDGGNFWEILDDMGIPSKYYKTRFSAPTLRPECTKPIQSTQDYEVFANAIANPAPPNDALKQAKAKYDEFTPNTDIDLLDKFAMAAMTGILASKRNEFAPFDVMAMLAYDTAQAMLNERKKYLTLNNTDNG